MPKTARNGKMPKTTELKKKCKNFRITTKTTKKVSKLLKNAKKNTENAKTEKMPTPIKNDKSY